MALEQLNTPPISSTSTYQTFLPPPETMAAKNAFTAIRTATTTLDQVLDKMIDHNYHVGILGSKFELDDPIETLTREIDDQDQDHKKALHEIELVLNDFLDKQVLSALKTRVEEEINKEIDQLVETHVKDHLEQRYIPEAVKSEVHKYKNDLEREHRRLHNSESKRANSLLRQRDGNVLLNTIYANDGNGEVSKDFPRTLQDLFDLDVTMCKSLATEYGLSGVSDSREKNLNLLLRFFGIAYQMVRTGDQNYKRVGVVC